MSEPPWLTYARSFIGVREIPGARHEPRIMAMIRRAAEAGWLGVDVTSDEVPWCGTFVADCLRHAGFKAPRGFIGVRARAYEKWGVAASTLDGRPPLGALAVFTRQGGGHVGFVVAAHRNGDVDILGGNQNNAVNIRRFPANRVTAYRWPATYPEGRVAPWSKASAPETTGEA